MSHLSSKFNYNSGKFRTPGTTETNKIENIMNNLFSTPSNNYHETNAPPGDANQLTGWFTGDGMYSNPDRRYLYEDSSWLHSSRIACDARISYMARQCYEGAFTEDQINSGASVITHPYDTDPNHADYQQPPRTASVPDYGGFLGGDTPFCATWSLQSLIDKCDAVGCASTYIKAGTDDVIDFNRRGDGRSFAEEALTLLIEDKLYAKDADWEKVVPAPYKNFVYVEKGCPVNCPTATTWSEWSCFCKTDVPENQDIATANVHNLPICNCQNKKRYRVQICSAADGGSCEIYSDGPGPKWYQYDSINAFSSYIAGTVNSVATEVALAGTRTYVKLSDGSINVTDPGDLSYFQHLQNAQFFPDSSTFASSNKQCNMYGNRDIVFNNENRPNGYRHKLWTYNGNKLGDYGYLVNGKYEQLINDDMSPAFPHTFPMFGYNDPTNYMGAYSSVSSGFSGSIGLNNLKATCDHMRPHGQDAWQDVNNRTCADYKSLGLCKADGSKGLDWNSVMGFKPDPNDDNRYSVNLTYANGTVMTDVNGTVLTELVRPNIATEFVDFAVKGKTAVDMCAECGCGAWFDLKTIMDYTGNATVEELTNWFFSADDRAIENTPGKECVDYSAKLTPQGYWEGLLNGVEAYNPRNKESYKLFSFAVEEDMCEPKGVRNVYDIGPCDKESGCGIQMVTTRCVYSATNITVPVDSEEYGCCSETKSIPVACNMHCCKSWHECNPQANNTCTADSDFTFGGNMYPAACSQTCGAEKVQKELRCMCQNTCVNEVYGDGATDDNYANARIRVGDGHPFRGEDLPTLEAVGANVDLLQDSDAQLEVAPAANTFNRYNKEYCGNVPGANLDPQAAINAINNLAGNNSPANVQTCQAFIGSPVSDIGIPVGANNYDSVLYRHIDFDECTNQCCVTIETNTGVCQQPECYMDPNSRNRMPWFLRVIPNHDSTTGYVCEAAGDIYQNGMQCVCDNSVDVNTPPNLRNVICTQNVTENGSWSIKTFNEGDTMVEDGPLCKYKRKDYINYNELVSGINNKGDEDDFFCCTEEIEEYLYLPWSEWDTCDFVDHGADEKNCGCADDPDRRCGMQTRRRRLKCAEKRVDETTCPCVETRKCMMPVCPKQDPFHATPIPCKFHYESSVTAALSYRAQQCRAREWEVMREGVDPEMIHFDHRVSWLLPDLFYSQNADQYVGPSYQSVDNWHNLNRPVMNRFGSQSHGECSWCKCDQQIQTQQSTNQCGLFKENCWSPQGVNYGCGNLEWAAWGQCRPDHHHKDATCGMGIRERTRVCIDRNGVEVFGVDAVNAHCYVPNVRRKVREADRLNLVDDPEHYKSEPCYTPCADDLVQWVAWGPCTHRKGSGIRLRIGHQMKEHPKFDEKNNDHEQHHGTPVTHEKVTQVEECDLKSRNKKLKTEGWSEWRIVKKCNVKCGQGTIVRTRYNHGTKKWAPNEKTPCQKAPCHVPDQEECPAFSLWAAWSQWSECSDNCGPDAKQTRSRCQQFHDRIVCDTDAALCAAKGRDKCTETETQSCNKHSDGTTNDGVELACPTCTCTADKNDWTNLHAMILPCDQDEHGHLASVNGQSCDVCAAETCGALEDWSDWDECSATCDGGDQYRTRSFVWFDGQVEGETDTQRCNEDACPAPMWSECTCDNDKSVRNNYGGIQCNQHNNAECQECNVDEVACGAMGHPVASECSATCGNATFTETTCFVWNDGRANSDADCDTVTKDCTGADCPVLGDCTCTSNDKDALTAEQCDQFGNCVACDASVCGTQGDFGDWSVCSVTCGDGTKSRSKAFNWADATKDDVVETETEACQVADPKTGNIACPGWGEWKAYGPCSGSCRPQNGGANPTKTRYRCWDDTNGERCGDGNENIDASNEANCNNEQCYQEDSADCNTQECVDVCSWEQWGDWTGCTPNCASGIKTRARDGTEACTESKSEGSECSSENPPLANCPACINKYSRCGSIAVAFCRDIRFQGQLEQMCAKHCSFCSKRRKRSARAAISADFNVDFDILEYLAGSD